MCECRRVQTSCAGGVAFTLRSIELGACPCVRGCKCVRVSVKLLYTVCVLKVRLKILIKWFDFDVS